MNSRSRGLLVSLLSVVTASCTLPDYQPIGRDSGSDTATQETGNCTNTMCGSTCVDLQTDKANCGACGFNCEALPNVQPNMGVTCAAGQCVIPASACATNFTRCPGAAIMDGCGTDTRLPENCGTCGNACTVPMNGVATCMSGTCGYTCNMGFTPAMSGLPPMCSGISPPQLIGPMSTSFTTSLRPRFRIKGVAGIDGATIQICSSRDCTTVLQTIDVPSVNTTTVSIAQPTMDLTPGVKFWRAFGKSGAQMGMGPSPVWEFYAAGTSSPQGNTSWGTMLDFNGDGETDLLVGSPLAGRSDEGGAWLYLGSTTSLPTVAPIAITSGSVLTGQRFGCSVASAGDVNGDGFGDIIIGAPGAGCSVGSRTTPGASRATAYVFFGNSRGVIGRPTAFTTTDTYTMGPDSAATSGFATVVRGLGDVDSDGYGDVGVFYDQSVDRAYIYRGNATGIGTSVATTLVPGGTLDFDTLSAPGDLNADGFADVLVADTTGASGFGEFRVYRGASTGVNPASPFTISNPESAYTGFGFSLAGVGDVNGDGFPDIAVGAPYHARGTTTNAGIVYVIPGSAGTLSTANQRTLEGTTMSQQLGRFVFAAGDVNANGLMDVAVTSQNGTATNLRLHMGDSALLLNTTAASTLTPPASTNGVWLGTQTSAAFGDFDGNRNFDVIVSDYSTTANAAAVLWYRGATNGWGTAPTALTLATGAANPYFGISIAAQ